MEPMTCGPGSLRGGTRSGWDKLPSGALEFPGQLVSLGPGRDQKGWQVKFLVLGVGPPGQGGSGGQVSGVCHLLMGSR